MEEIIDRINVLSYMLNLDLYNDWEKYFHMRPLTRTLRPIYDQGHMILTITCREHCRLIDADKIRRAQPKKRTSPNFEARREAYCLDPSR